MIFLDQLLKKDSDQGPNLTSYKFQTKWRGSDFWLTAQIAPQLRDSASYADDRKERDKEEEGRKKELKIARSRTLA